MYIPRGVREASDILSKSTKFLIYYDPDIDGAISGELTRRFLTAYNQPFMYYINENRQHGLKMPDDKLNQLVGFTILLVDAGMTKQEIIKLTSMGINIINIDHHHINEDDFVYVENEQTGARGVIVNNQYPFEPEEYRFLSGAGVVYYVLKAMGFGTKEEKALVGLSLLSDIRPIENDIAKDFLHATYNHKTQYLQYLIDVAKPDRDFGFGIQTFDRNYIDFTFSPKINALFRLNKGDDAISIFSGSYKSQGELDVYRRIQNSIRDTIIENLKGTELSNLTYKYVDSNLPLPYQFDITNFVGLACSQLKNFGKTTILFVRENGNIKRGSVRGLCDDVDYLEVFRHYGFKAEGHKNAFGVLSVDFSNVDLHGLNATIEKLEFGYEERKYTGRLLDVNNLAFFLNSKNASFADYNNYVRDHSRIFLRYTGSNIERYQKGKAIEYNLDGVKVLAFDESLAVNDALILPVSERGGYIQFYLKGY